MLTLPVSLFRSESMAFGKPKKVGMPKKNKKAVAVADDVPVMEGALHFLERNQIAEG